MAREIQDIKELFINFLLENDCFSQFCINLLEFRNISLEEYLNWNYCEKELIRWAFDWKRTSEGRIFWYKLNSKWQNKL